MKGPAVAESRPIKPYNKEGDHGGVLFEIVSEIDNDDDIELMIDEFEYEIQEMVAEYVGDMEVMYELRHAIRGQVFGHLTLVRGYQCEIIQNEGEDNRYLRAARRVSTSNDLVNPIRIYGYHYE